MLSLSPQSTGKILATMVSLGPFGSNPYKPGFRHKGTGSCEELVLMVCVVRSCICNIIKNFLSIQAITLCNRKEADWAEGTLGVDIQTLSFSPTHIDR
jgi:hypothetical protein